MTIKLTPIFSDFAGRLEGIDAGNMSGEDVAAVKKAMVQFPILVLPDQHMDHDQQSAFAHNFGPIDVNELGQKFNKKDVPREFAEPSRNDPKNPQDPRLLLFELSNAIWHTDSSFKTTPAKHSMLYCLKAPRQGGETQYVDLRVAYDRLPPDLKEVVEGGIAEHCSMMKRIMFGYEHSEAERAAFKAISAYDLVRTLPESGRKSLYLSGHASRIFGHSYAESRLLLNDLMEYATTLDNVYTHRWAPNDFVIWDNRCTMHRMRRYNVATEERHVRRISTRDDAFPSRDHAALVEQYAGDPGVGNIFGSAAVAAPSMV